MVLKDRFDVRQLEGDVVKWEVKSLDVTYDFGDMTIEQIAERFAVPSLRIAVQAAIRKGTLANAQAHKGAVINAKDYRTGSRVKMTLSEKITKAANGMDKDQIANLIEQLLAVQATK